MSLRLRARHHDTNGTRHYRGPERSPSAGFAVELHRLGRRRLDPDITPAGISHLAARGLPSPTLAQQFPHGTHAFAETVRPEHDDVQLTVFGRNPVAELDSYNFV